MKKAMRAAGCIITVILTIGLLMWTSNLTVRKDSSDKYSDFFRDRDYDVLFMGTSHVIDSVFPMELWKEYGIVSYNCGGTSNYLPTTYWVLQNVLDYVTPKVVVIDCYRLADDEKCPIIERAHYSLDSFPLSMNKIKAVLDLMDDPGGKTAEQAEKAANIAQSPSLELLWNFAFYHSRWNELEKDDFSPTSTKEKGAEPQINVVRGKLKRIDRDLTSEAGHTGEVYLRRMIEDCRERGIEVMLTYLPFQASEAAQREANRAYAVAEEYEIPYVNFLEYDDIIDYQTDLYDSYSHLNVSGARKVTSWIGRFLMEQYSLPDKRNDPAYSYWEEDYREYEAVKNNYLESEDDIVNYLMLLAEDDIDVMIYIQDQDIFRNKQVLLQLENLGVDTSGLDKNTDYILISSKGKKTVVLNDFTVDGKTEKTKLGDAAVFRTGSSMVLNVDGWQSMSVQPENVPGIRIDVYRGYDFVDCVKFNYTVQSNQIRVTNVSRD